MTVRDLPALNAALNGSSALLLAAGWLLIRGGRAALHRLCMLAALVVSAVFLTSYLVYHAHVGSVRYTGPARGLYLAILASHTALAVVNVPLIARTVQLSMSGRLAQHQRLARWTLPSWFYVSVTGVVVYWMLYA